MTDSTPATAATCSHGPGCPLPWSLHDWSYEADYATAASIPYEGTDCTADEAVEAVKAVRTTAATVTLTLTRRERIILAYALRHYANALDAEDFATDGYDGPLETSADCRALSDKVRDA